jgi:DNA-binding MarR family transcriptional regulator
MYIMSMYSMTPSRPAATRVPPPPIGQEVALAQRALSELLARFLGEADTTFGTWLALNTLATQGPAIRSDALRRDLAGRLQVDQSSISQLLHELQSTGAARLTGAGEEAQVELTDDGAAIHRRLSEGIRRNTAELLGPLDPDDVHTTIRVLRAVTERAQALQNNGSTS